MVLASHALLKTKAMSTKNSYQTAATLLVAAGLIYTAYILSKKVKSVEIEALGLLRVKIEN